MSSREENGEVYRKVKKGDHLIPLDEFSEIVSQGGLIDYDGYGYLMKNDQVLISMAVSPSDWPFIERKDFTHIVWINK